MRRLMSILRRRQGRAKQAGFARPLEPIRCDASGSIQLNMATVQRLQHLHAVGFLYREQIESAASECCQLLGVDPDSGSIEADWCREIVLYGTPVSVAIERLSQRCTSTGKRTR